jgi:hypothetical protein
VKLVAPVDDFVRAHSEMSRVHEGIPCTLAWCGYCSLIQTQRPAGERARP